MIPTAARPVVEEIRRLVPKPDELPVPGNSGLGFTNPCFGWCCDAGHCCPLGLLPYALGDRPVQDRHYQLDADDLPFSSAEAESFWRWWDAQRDAEKAVAEVWDEELVT